MTPAMKPIAAATVNQTQYESCQPAHIVVCTRASVQHVPLTQAASFRRPPQRSRLLRTQLDNVLEDHRYEADC